MTAISAQLIAERLASVGEPCFDLALGDGATLLVSRFGGRVYGPFLDGVDDTGWLPSGFATPTAFVALHRGGTWNLGGERIWLSPEIAYLVGDRARFWDTFAVPAQLDPGRHRMERDRDGLVLALSARLGPRRVDIVRTLRPAVDPPWHGRAGLRSAGYRQVIDTGSDDLATPVVPWIIRQVAPGGVAALALDPGASGTAMFGDPPACALECRDGALRIAIDAGRMFKVGVPGRRTSGRLGCLYENGSCATYLHYEIGHDRDGLFHDEPPDRPGCGGFSHFVFQDDGSLGRYGELEGVGKDLGIDRDGRRRGSLAVTTWVVVGEAREVRAAAAEALAIGTQASGR